MNIVHRISFRANVSQREELQALGVEVPSGIMLPGGGEPHVSFDIAEDHANWEALQRLFLEWGVGDVVRTEFSKVEVEAASWSCLVSDWHHGYPQPEKNFGYLEATYDLADWCYVCGVGLKQKAPFIMRGEPKWGRRGMLQLNWVFDEFFATPEVWSDVFRPLGVGSRPVLGVSGSTLRTVVQLVVEEEAGVIADELTPERCGKCGREKYGPVVRGFFPSLTAEPSARIVKTKEYFGSGAAAHRNILVQAEVVHALIAGRVRGVSFHPCASS